MENGCWRFQWATMWFLQSVSGVTAGAATEAAGYIECPEPARLPTRVGMRMAGATMFYSRKCFFDPPSRQRAARR
jgi:hypothetical protein